MKALRKAAETQEHGLDNPKDDTRGKQAAGDTNGATRLSSIILGVTSLSKAMDGLDDSAARIGPVNVPVSSEREGSAGTEDDGGSGINRALEESLSTLPCGGVSELGTGPSGSGRPDVRRGDFATQRSCSSTAMECCPTPGEMPFEDRDAEVVNGSMRDSRVAQHSAVSNNGSAYQAEVPSGDRTKEPSRTSLTMNSTCAPNTARMSASQNLDPSAGLDCGRTGLVRSPKSPIRSEQKFPASVEGSTIPRSFRTTTSEGLPIGAAGSLFEEIVEGDPQQPASSQNAGVHTTAESKISAHLPLTSAVERVSATSADPKSSATAPKREHTASCFSGDCGRGETVGESPSASMPCATNNGDATSQETSKATSARFTPHEAGCQAAGAKGHAHPPILRTEHDGLDVAASGGGIPAMAAGRSIPDVTGVCPVGQDEAIATEQRVDAVRTLASATVVREETAPHSKIGPSASLNFRRVDRDAADGASVPGAAQAPEERGPASSNTSTSGLVTPLTTVAVARTPFRALSTTSRPSSAHESSYNVIAPGTDVPREGHPGSGVTVPSREAGEPLANECALSSSARHATSLGCGEECTRLEDEHAEPLCLAGTADHDSAGDTADVALAAFSYANAVAEERHIDDPTCSTTLRLGDSGEPIGSVSNGTGGGSSVRGAGVALASADGATDGFAMPRRPSQESNEVVTLSATTAVASESAQAASRALSTCGAASRVKASSESASRSASGKAQGGGGSNCSASAGRGQKRARSKSDQHDDLMHAMCMICLEKLSDAGEGGEAKLLGLLDSCSHRYCYTCILEWSKITNKCPQCKARFHTIKAVKELRRKNERYRGVAVRVENRDQVYSYVDVRDVVVLDPGVECHIGCLVRRGVDALQQGWEFSVQCEQCSKWYHGLCVGFRQEWQVPDLWFCRPCRGEEYQIVLDPEAITEPAAIVNRGRASPGGSRSGNRGADGGVPREGPIVPTSFSAQGASAEVESGQAQGPQQGNDVNSVPETGRAEVDTRPEPGSNASTSDAGLSAVDIAPTQQAPVGAATPTLRAPVESPRPSLLPMGTALGVSRTPNESPATSSTNLPPLERMETSLDGGQQGLAASSPALSTVENIVNPSGAQQHARATPSPSNTSPRPLLPSGANPAPPVPPPVAVPPPRGRGRPRGSRNKATTSRPPQPPRQIPARATPSTAAAAAAGTHPTAALPPPGAAPPARPRGRPRGSKNKPKVQPPAQPAAAPPTPPASAPQPDSRSTLPPSTELPVPPPREEQQQLHQEDQTEEAKGTLIEDVLPQPPEPPSPSLLRSLDGGSVTDLCEICGFDTEPDNLIVYCESCNMGVHQTCYGISEIPTREWYCSPCSAGVHPSTLACRFCPVKGGALKRCTDDSWGHILCAFWIPECCFIDPQKMEPIGSINRRGQAGGVDTFLPHFRSRKCYICGTSAGSAIRCHTASCKFHLHPMCGSRAGSVYMEIETTMKRGADGTEHESVSLVAKCPRHNKSKATSGRPHKGRPPVASATDPLAVLGKTLEITDPEQGDAVALAGKATWYNPDRSRYCIVTARHLGDSDDHNGSAEPKEACSHWITVDKLVEAGAMGVLKGGKRVLLEALPASGEAGTQVDAQSVFQESGLKDEEGGGAEKEEAGKGSVVSSAEDLGDKKIAVVNLEETVSKEKNVGTAVAGKRCRADALLEPTASPEVSAAKRTARAGVGLRQAKVPTGMESQSSQPVPEALALPTSPGESSPSSSEYRAGSEIGTEGFGHSAGIGGRGVFARCPLQQQNRLLPSVHIPEKGDTSSRYPIRGRLRRQTHPASEEPRVFQKAPSVERQRLADEASQSLTITADAVSDSSSGAEAYAGEAKVSSADVPSTTSRTSDRVPIHQKSRSPPCAEASIPRNEVHGSHERSSTYRLEPGWPDGMQFLGHVPVMCVRAVRVRSDGDTMYFASGYKDAEGAVGHKRSSSRFSFHFEGLEKPGFDIRSNHVRHQDTLGSSTDSHLDLNSEPGAEQRALEGEGSTQTATRNTEGSQGETRPTRTGALRVRNEEETEHGGKPAEGEGLPDDGVEEGEIGALSEGLEGTLPSRPREGRSTDAENANGGSANGVQGDQRAAMSGGVPAQAAARNAGNPTSVASDDKHAADVEEMEISSDDESYSGFEGAEPASSCVSDDEASDADAHAAVDRDLEDAAGHHGTNTSATVLSEERSAFPQSSLSAAIEREANAEKQSAAGGGQKSHVKSCLESVPEDGNEMPPLEKEPETAPAPSLPPRETEAVLSLRSIVRTQLQGVLRSASKGKESAVAREDANDVIVEIADDAEDMLFRLLYKESTGGREYKAKYKQLMLALGNVRNYRLVASVLAGSTTPADLATKDAVGLLNSLSSSLNCLAMPLAGRQRQGSQLYSPAGSSAGNSHKGKGKRLGKMQML